jgi:hypothetical protein
MRNSDLQEINELLPKTRQNTRVPIYNWARIPVNKMSVNRLVRMD